jgi:pimeloyl-[acyl-carrier protein] methyl ester esterase
VSGSGKTTLPLVLLHGWGMTPAVWHPLIAALDRAPADADLYTPALPGHLGEASSAPPTLSAWAEALVPALPPAAVIVGWSLGALLALELARFHPQKVARLVLIGATPRFVSGPDWPHGLTPETVTAFINGYASQPAATLRRFLALQTLGDAARRRLLPQLEAACVPHPAAQPLPALADGLQILVDSDLRPPPTLAAIEQPAHLIHGDGDALMPLAAARSLADALSHARLSVLANCGHAPLLSRPAECAALIRAQLDAQETARAR